MLRIKAKSVYSPIKKTDGLRILATRFRGRGLRSELYDVWMPNLAPSETLLRSGRSGKINWAEFTRQYRAELFDSGNIDGKNLLIKNRGQKFTLRLLQRLAEERPVSIMCHCAEQQKQCHRHRLARALNGKI